MNRLPRRPPAGRASSVGVCLVLHGHGRARSGGTHRVHALNLHAGEPKDGVDLGLTWQYIGVPISALYLNMVRGSGLEMWFSCRILLLYLELEAYS